MPKLEPVEIKATEMDIFKQAWVSLTETEADFLTELHDERS